MNRFNEIRHVIETIKHHRRTNPQHEHIAVATTLGFSPEELTAIGAAVECESIFYNIVTCELRATFSTAYKEPERVVELPNYKIFTTVELILLRSALREFPEDKAHLDKVVEILRTRGIG
jgi:hypothetical protein